MPNRRLVLNREGLTALDSDEMSSVVGAISGLHYQCVLSLYYTCRVSACDCRPWTDTCE